MGTDPSNHWRCGLGRTIFLLLLEHEMKTNELTGDALNTAVHNLAFPNVPINDDCTAPPYSTDWAFGGPLIEREKIGTLWEARNIWSASTKWDDPTKVFYGKTKLIAAMRCYVASKLGEEVLDGL